MSTNLPIETRFSSSPIPPHLGRMKEPNSCNACGEPKAKQVYQVGVLEDGRPVMAVCHDAVCALALVAELTEFQKSGDENKLEIHGDLLIGPAECAAH